MGRNRRGKSRNDCEQLAAVIVNRVTPFLTTTGMYFNIASCGFDQCSAAFHFKTRATMRIAVWLRPGSPYSSEQQVPQSHISRSRGVYIVNAIANGFYTFLTRDFQTFPMGAVKATLKPRSRGLAIPGKLTRMEGIEGW